MANPQIERGYVRIANELLEAICRLNISGNEMRILLYIIRRTYGFNRSYAEISLSEFSTATGIRNVHVSRALKRLSELNIIERHSSKKTIPQTVSINKNYEEWTVESYSDLLLPKMVTVTKNGNSAITKNGNNLLPKMVSTITKNGNHTYKDNIKDNIKDRGKDSTPRGRYGNVFLSDDEISKLNQDYGEEHIRDYIQRVDSHVQSTGKAYADYDATIRKWLEQDGVKKSDSEYDFENDKYAFVFNNF